MASKKAGRLAGLAALAGLAYMNKDKLFGAKGETKAAETTAETKVKDTAAEDAKAAAKRDADEETMGYTSSGNAAMYEKEPGFETKTTPAKVARSEKAPSASVAKAPVIGGPTPARDPGGAGKRGAVSAGPTPARDPGGIGKRGGVGDGGHIDEQAKLMSSYKPRRPDVKLRDARYHYPATQESGAYTNKQLKKFGAEERSESEEQEMFGKKRGGVVKKMASGGMTSSASKRADGIATKGKTRGKMY